ncbi:ABC transporter ATP-binding protein [Paenibacillus macquariensis]|uniref:ABC-2 type transport system ATP-binding protein n=1 Tax=Paenibacillus macquariensis TaxID=948756 RepID=A0ABY1KAG3_9BACL|nr:ABC transporter ATP-binding protein [Paenibacillus macquariensis]MEC0093722.1 ABC transporter ATP-binding protein [Paenibacillus macquariensis]OAB31669.1 ABC transporter ATP-binding protein [Paenibacillus macquariensis subsp. macquariensis]SIR50392.1 ABC-2 type transport system ATP-binding protein [Paenibacillus macquariensis]
MEKIIEVRGISKAYGKRKTKEKIHAVRDVSFDVNRGEVLGLLGPNGAGKTSTIKMLCGLLESDAGSITINGLDIYKKRLKALEHISAVLEGNRNLYWRLTVRENLEYFAGNRGYSRKQVAYQADKLLEQFNLKDKENELVNGLSRGMQQKLAIAVALLANTDVILLDEPTLGLDVEVSYELRNILNRIVKEEKRTIIISSHDMPVVQELCDRVIIINKGEVVIDDRVENLLRLFETRAYSIKLGEELSINQKNKLLSRFPLSTYKASSHETIVEVNLEHGQDIYELFDLLKEEGTMVESIDRITIDFEQVFMQIVKGGMTNEMATPIQC